jgi:hypothetical protein
MSYHPSRLSNQARERHITATQDTSNASAEYKLSAICYSYYFAAQMYDEVKSKGFDATPYEKHLNDLRSKLRTELEAHVSQPVALSRPS